MEAIHDYISEFDCVANANYVLDELMDVVESLTKFQERGRYPKELVGQIGALGLEFFQLGLQTTQFVRRIGCQCRLQFLGAGVVDGVGVVVLGHRW